MEHFLWLIALGFVLGAFGTLIGVGGGFVLAPVLLLLYPQAEPETIASISLAVVFLNALSGSFAYARMGRIDYKAGLLFAAATIPGAIIGAMTTGYIPRREFNFIFGLLMVVSAAYLSFHRTGETEPAGEVSKGHAAGNIAGINGPLHASPINLKLGMFLSLFVGYLSSLLGIGGGIFHVPLLIRILRFPVLIATATSQFILAIMALTGTIVHIAAGSFSQGGIYRTVFLGIGVVLGAQLGAWLSGHVQGMWIIRGLAVALALIGIRIFIMALQP
jgi:uncharacterized membrane protein YfcA